MNSKSSRSQWQPGGPAMGIAGEVWARPRSSGPPQGQLLTPHCPRTFHMGLLALPHLPVRQQKLQIRTFM